MLRRQGLPADRPRRGGIPPRRVVISSAGKLVPFGDDKIKASQDHLMHVCTYSTGAVRVRCLYVPDPRT